MKNIQAILSGKKAIELMNSREKSGEIMVNVIGILQRVHIQQLLLRMNLIGCSNYLLNAKKPASKAGRYALQCLPELYIVAVVDHTPERKRSTESVIISAGHMM